MPRLVGCAGSQEPNCLSLQFGEMQGDFCQFAGTSPSNPSRRPSHPRGWIGLSLTQEQGDHKFMAGKVDMQAPCSSATNQVVVEVWAPGESDKSARIEVELANDVLTILNEARLTRRLA